MKDKKIKIPPIEVWISGRSASFFGFGYFARVVFGESHIEAGDISEVKIIIEERLTGPAQAMRQAQEFAARRKVLVAAEVIKQVIALACLENVLASDKDIESEAMRHFQGVKEAVLRKFVAHLR